MAEQRCVFCLLVFSAAIWAKDREKEEGSGTVFSNWRREWKSNRSSSYYYGLFVRNIKQRIANMRKCLFTRSAMNIFTIADQQPIHSGTMFSIEQTVSIP